MGIKLNGDHETLDYKRYSSMILYDNIENEEYPLHWHNAVEIIMPLNNGFEAVCAGKEYKLDERDVLIIPSGTLHNLNAQSGRRLILLINNDCFANNPALTELYPILSDTILINSENGKDLLHSLNSMIEEIYTLYSNFSGMSEVYIYIKVISMLTRLKEYKIGNVKYAADDRYVDTFKPILKYIENNYMNDITLDDLSEMAGYSTYHFSRIFKKYCNTTFSNYLNQRRVKAAEMLLLERQNSITDVAMKVGFSSITTFNRVFKSINGCTPSDFKKLYRTAHKF